ncbi:hypothetical protein CA951_33325 [Rhodococcus sp. NCIMB 12038]|nr:hypothetical protein CA951_33325 [Rhodococcus sp. NCIMB 12038]
MVIAWSNTRVTFVGPSKSHAMAAFLGYDTPVRFAPPASKTCCQIRGSRGSLIDEDAKRWTSYGRAAVSGEICEVFFPYGSNKLTARRSRVG